MLSIIAMMLLTSMSPAVQVQIRGVVTDDSGAPLAGVMVKVKGTGNSVVTNNKGEYLITPGREAGVLIFSITGMQTVEEPVAGRTVINVVMKPALHIDKEKKDSAVAYDEVFVVCEEAPAVYSSGYKAEAGKRYTQYYAAPVTADINTEAYAGVKENGYKDPLKDPLSTFSIDVDNASYSNVRRFINLGQKVPEDAVRIEEMINYFRYDYPEASGEHPFSLYTETGVCPWNKNHYLLHVGLKGKEIEKGELPPSNLVFLVDVSGSMDQPNKLPLLKSAFGLLIAELRPQDRVAMVVYAGAAGVVLESTPGNRKEIIMQAMDNLRAGGSTAGGQGLMLAYRIAEQNFMREGNNRIILATDGDFNVGPSDNTSMEKLVEEKRGLGIYLTVLGFGMGNIKDDKMELMADRGNGNYAYIDNIQEARRVLVREFGGTLFTIAKDVKLQVEFNPAYVKSYRLVGYENRILDAEDFNDDTKDAGEMGSGHNVTALYEIVPAGSDENIPPSVDPLRYQNNGDTRTSPARSMNAPRELCNIKIRYKEPDGITSKLMSRAVGTSVSDLNETTDRFRFSAAVASFGMLLRNSPFRGTATRDEVVALASGARGTDPDGYRAEFIRLVQSSR